MAYELAKTLYVGLGGTGAKTLIKVKGMFIENFGDVPPMIKFWCIDTDDKVSHLLKNGTEITFNTDEFTKITIPSVEKFCRIHPKVTSFIPQDVIQAKPSVVKGAGSFRSIGRLALLKEHKNIVNTCRNYFNKVKNWAGGMNEDYTINPDRPARIIVVFSIAGGTGSGMFIDFPLMIRDAELLQEQETIIGVGLMPDIFAAKGSVMVKNCRPNAAAAMLEAEFIQDGKLAVLAQGDDDPAINILTGSNSSKYVVGSKLYDSFFLVNNVSSKDFSFNKVDELTDFLATSLYLMGGSTGAAQESSLDNISAVNNGMDKDGKVYRYLGLGVAELYLDSDVVADYYALSYLKMLIDKLLGSSGQILDIDEELQRRITEWRTQEDKKEDQVIDALVDPAKRKRITKTFAGVPIELKKEYLDQLKSSKENWIKKRINEIKSHLYGIDSLTQNGSLNKLKGEKLNLLEKYIKSALEKEGGINYTSSFLERLIGRYSGMMEEMKSEIEEYDKKIEDLKVRYNNLEEAIETILNNISPLDIILPNRKIKKLEEISYEYNPLVNEEVEYYLEKLRRKAAVEFYEVNIEKAKELKSKIENFKRVMEDKLQRIIAKQERIKNSQTIQPFKVGIHSDYLEYCSVKHNEVDFLHFVEEVKLPDLVMRGLTKDEVFNELENYVNQLEKTKELRDENILDALQKFPEKARKELVKKLKTFAGVMRVQDKNYLIDTDRAYVIGIHQKDHPAIQQLNESRKTANKNIKYYLDQEFSSHGNPPEITLTKDPKRIIISCYESGVPAFIIKDFKLYEEELNNYAGPSLFSNKQWKELIVGYSLQPASKEDSMLGWTLAILATYLEKSKSSEVTNNHVLFHKEKRGNYYVWSPEGDIAKGYLFDLKTSKRDSAYEVFCEKRLFKNIIPKASEIINNYNDEFNKLIKRIKNDARFYLDEVANHGLDQNALESERHKNTREMIRKEHQFIVTNNI